MSTVRLVIPIVCLHSSDDFCIFYAVPHGVLHLVIRLHFYHGRKWHAFYVDRTALIGYTTYIAIPQKPLGRYCKPSCAKKRDGSFFVRIYHIALLNKCHWVILGVSAVHLLHIVHNKAVFSWAQVHDGHHRLSILRFRKSKTHKPAIRSRFPASFTLQNQCRILQNLGDLFNFRQRHLRVVLHDLFDLVPLHVDVALDGTQSLHHRPRATQGKSHALRHVILHPAVDLVREILPDLPLDLRRSVLLYRPPAIPGSIHQGVVPNFLQLLGVLHHGAAFRPVCRQALHGGLQAPHPLADPAADALGQASIFPGQLLHRLAVLQHHLAGIGHHLVHGLLVGESRLPSLLVRHQVVKADALLPGQLFHNEVFQHLVLLRAALLDVVGDLVGSGLQNGRLPQRHPVPSSVDVQIQGAVLVKAVGPLIFASLVGLALIEYHIHSRGLSKGFHGAHGGPLAAIHGFLVHRRILHASHCGPSQAHSGLFLRGAIHGPAGPFLFLSALQLPLVRLCALLVGDLPLGLVQMAHRLGPIHIVHGHTRLAVFIGVVELPGVGLQVLPLPVRAHQHRPRLA